MSTTPVNTMALIALVKKLGGQVRITAAEIEDVDRKAALVSYYDARADCHVLYVAAPAAVTDEVERLYFADGVED